MTDKWIEALGSAGAVFLFWHFLMLGPSVTGLLLERVLRRQNAHARSALLRSTLMLALAIPLGCTIWGVLPPRVAPPTTPAQSVGSTAPVLPEFTEVDWNQVAVWRPLVTDIEQVPGNLLPLQTAGIPSTTIAYASFIGLSVLASLCFFGRFVAAIVRCAALRRPGRPLAAGDEKRYRAVAEAMGVSAPPALTVKSPESPILLGFFRPVILLPEGMTLRDEIFSHELTHLRRHDLIWHLLARIAAMLMPLQPGFWLLKKALERADEDVCDDAVLVHGADAANYAKLLLHVAESQRAPNPELCLPMAAFRSQLERRLHRLLDAMRPLARRLSFSVLCLGLTPVFVAGLLAGAIFLDSERAAAVNGPMPSANDKPTTDTSPSNNAPPEKVYGSFLRNATPDEKSDLISAYQTVDQWHTALDWRGFSAVAQRLSDNAPPDYLNGKPVTPDEWKDYLGTTYARLGQMQSRQLKTMLRGWINGAENAPSSDLSLAYETEFRGATGTTRLGENISVHRDDHGRWHVVRFLTFTPTEPPAPIHANSATVRSVDLEFVGKPDDDDTKSKVLAASGLEIGSPCSATRIHRAMRQIFATGLFANSAIRTTPLPDGIKVSIIVQPNPTVAEINFEGIPAGEQARLAARVHLHSQKGAMGSDYLIFQDAQAITSELAAEGLHLAAKGSTKLIDPVQSTASVTFAIAPPLP